MGKQILLIKLSILTVSANFNKTARKENENKTKESCFVCAVNESDHFYATFLHCHFTFYGVR